MSIENEERKSITPERYVWHVSECSVRDSILRFGLVTNQKYKIDKQFEKPALFANNQSSNVYLMWPLPIHRLESGMDIYEDDTEIKNYRFLSRYDFWQIDTLKIKDHNWFLDPRMATDFIPYDCVSPNHYIFTDKDVPREALKLFNVGKVEIEPIVTIDDNGVAHVSASINGISELDFVEILP